MDGNLYRKLMVPLTVVAAAAAFASPAFAGVGSVAPAGANTGCSEIGLQDKGDGYLVGLSSSGLLEFYAGTSNAQLCVAPVAGTDYQTIYTSPAGTSGGWCLAWDSDAGDVYNHNSGLCDDTPNTSYLEWNFVYEGTTSGGVRYYMLTNPDTGLCFYSEGSTTPEYMTCNPKSQADEFYE